MLRKIILSVFVIAALACKSNPRVNPDLKIDGSGNLKADPKQELVAKNLVKLIEAAHYNKIKLTDSLSSAIFDRYLTSLDQGHNYLLAADLKDFQQYRNTLDDDLRNGDLSAFFKIFNVYQSRLTDRIKYAMSRLTQPVNLSTGGTFIYDRSKLPWFSSEAESDQAWSGRVKYELLNLKVSGGDSLKNKDVLKKRYENLLSQTAKTNNQDAFQIMMSAYTESVDPHTNYFVPTEATRFNEEMSKNFEGIGARLTLENEVVKVSEIIGGGPAAKAKTLHANDRIIGVAQGSDGEFVDVIGWRLDNTVSKIKGPKGTIVKLKIIPAGLELTSAPKIVELKRDKVVLEDQSAKKTIKTVTNGGKTYKIGVITIPDFYADFKAAQRGDPDYKSTTRDVHRILDTLKIQKVDAVVIDLRRNGGGSLSEAIDLGGLFIKSGPIVQTKGGRNVSVLEDEDPGIAWDGPLGIMVDRFSASASEIFAAAMQDYGRAIIMGTQTYGKGTLQKPIDLEDVIPMTEKLGLMAHPASKDEDNKTGTMTASANPMEFGQVNLTQGKFYRINGNSTQRKGVMPDISFPMIYPASKYGEESQTSALPWDSIRSSNFTSYSDLRSARIKLAAQHDQRMKSSAEYKYLVDDIAAFNKTESENSVTLNEVQLKKERTDQQAKTLLRDNQRRALKGLAPLKKGEVAKRDDIDFVEDESLQVMIDFIKLKSTGSAVTRVPVKQF